MGEARGTRARIDALLQRSNVTAFPAAVLRKYGDDRGGTLAAVITYHGFLAIFPLTVALSTVLGIVARGRPELRREIVDSALADFPVIGAEIRRNVGALAADGALRLTIALAITLWGAIGVANALQQAMARVWNVPETRQPRLLTRLARAVGLFAILGLGSATSVVASAVASLGRGVVGVVVGVAVSFAAAFGLFVLAFRVLTPLRLETRTVLPGAAFGALVWTALQLLGTYLLTRRLQDLDELYGTFAAVLGLLWWIHLSSQLTVLAAEVNVVRARRLWPRSLLDRERATEPADRVVLRDLAEAEQRAHDETIAVDFDTQERGSR